MVTFTSADAALKSLYLGVVSEQLNTGINPLLAKIEQTTSDVWGKEIIKLAPYGLNGGIGAGTEDGNLPTAAENQYVRFKSELKNLYGTIELSDKAVRASQNNAGAFVNLLNSEMEGLLKASKFNFGRMLYGDGSGKLATVVTYTGNSNYNKIKLNTVKNVMEGMVIDCYDDSGDAVSAMCGTRITAVDRVNKIITVDAANAAAVAADGYITIQGSKNLELTGLGAIFNTSASTLYGLTIANYPWLKPYVNSSVGAMSSSAIQEAIDYVDEVHDSKIDFIVCASNVKRMYMDYCAYNRTNVDYMNLDNGFKALSYNGIPLMSDRFVEDGAMYLLNSKDFKLHQLCDWRWLEGEDGRILKQKAGKATYSATLVKYADLLCDKPCGQIKLSGFTAASN